MSTASLGVEHFIDSANALPTETISGHTISSNGKSFSILDCTIMRSRDSTSERVKIRIFPPDNTQMDALAAWLNAHHVPFTTHQDSNEHSFVRVISHKESRAASLEEEDAEIEAEEIRDLSDEEWDQLQLARHLKAELRPLTSPPRGR